jgi:hypothetical protein
MNTQADSIHDFESPHRDVRVPETTVGPTSEASVTASEKVAAVDAAAQTEVTVEQITTEVMITDEEPPATMDDEEESQLPELGEDDWSRVSRKVRGEENRRSMRLAYLPRFLTQSRLIHPFSENLQVRAPSSHHFPSMLSRSLNTGIPDDEDMTSSEETSHRSDENLPPRPVVEVGVRSGKSR